MLEDSILIEFKKSVAWITLNRPDVHNAFDEGLISLLHDTLEEIAVRDDIYAVVLSGAGKSFSAGADLNWMARAANFTEEQNKKDALKLARMLNRLYTLPQLTIACVHGAAMGGGLGLVACCDIALATKQAVFSLSEVKLGLIPATIGPYVLRAVGERHARRYFQTAERFDADTAFSIGLVQDVSDTPEDMDKSLSGILESVAANGPLAMRESKKLCLDLAGKSVTGAVIEDTAGRIAKTRCGGEARSRVSAFLEKKK